MKNFTTMVTWLNLYRLPVGRRLNVLKQVRKLLADTVHTDVKALVEEAHKHDLTTLDKLRRAGAVPQQATGADGATELDLDSDIDRVLGGIDDACDAKVKALGESSPGGAAAGRIKATAFPKGVGHAVRMAHAEAEAEVGRILGMMLHKDDPRSEELDAPEGDADWRGRLRADVETAGLVDMADRLAELYQEFMKIRGEGKPRPVVTKADADAANIVGEEYMVGVFCSLVALYPKPTEEHEKLRAPLLEPYFTHNDAMADYYRRNAKPKDVDPDTGDPVETPEDEEKVMES